MKSVGTVIKNAVYEKRIQIIDNAVNDIINNKSLQARLGLCFRFRIDKLFFLKENCG